MKKIAIEKEEGIAEVIDRMLGEPDDEVALVIPKGSALARSVSNFHLLKREADAAGKTVAIESVDDTILAFAKQSDLESNHPLWRGVRGAGEVSDIVPAGREDEEGGAENSEPAESERPAPPARRKKRAAPVKLTVPAEEEPEEAEVPFTVGAAMEPEAQEKRGMLSHVRKFWKKRAVRRRERRLPRRMSRKLVLWGGAVLALLIILFSLITWTLGHAAVTINFKRTPWEYQGTFLADKTVSKMNAVNNTIPAQVFSTKKNATQSFPASGSANVSMKARGAVTIYNAYSSAAQDLVATTRFVTPDGKIFRLLKAVRVPGASVTNGEIVPSSIDTLVVADQAGPDYNVGPLPKLSIPGFKGSPKYAAFYGALKSGASGGLVGKKAVPTAADITNAKAKITATLRSSLTSDLTTSYPNNFKILDGATNVSITKLTVSTTTDDKGTFAIFGEAVFQAVGFDEVKFKDFLLSLAQSAEPNSAFDSFTPTYGNVRADFTKGTVSFSLSVQGTLKPAFSPDDFRKSIAGKSIGDARTAIASLPGLADGKISIWPVWLWKMPGNPDKISINAD